MSLRLCRANDLSSLGNVKTTWRDGQDSLALFVEPPGLVESLALRTVPVATGIVRRPLVAAVLADVHMPAENGGSAGLDAPHDLALLSAEPMRGAICVAVRPKDLRNLVLRPVDSR